MSSIFTTQNTAQQIKRVWIDLGFTCEQDTKLVAENFCRKFRKQMAVPHYGFFRGFEV